MEAALERLLLSPLLREKLLIMWLVLLIFYTLKILCIFIFIMYCVITFLMIMYDTRTAELRKCIAISNTKFGAELSNENRISSDDNLKPLTEKSTEKEPEVKLQRSNYEIKQAELALSDLENKTSTCRDRYRSLMVELKKDIRKTEDEVKILQNQISNLSIRRETLKDEVTKQQEDYQKMLNNFTKELENKKTFFSTGIEKSRHPRVSRFALP